MKATPLFLLGLTSSLVSAGTFLDIRPGTNNSEIKQVVLTQNGTDVTQNVEAPDYGVGPPPISGTTPVIVKSVSISNGTPVNLNLTFFNTSGAEVRNVASHITAANGIGVYDNGAITTSRSNTQAYANALAATTMDTDLRNFSFYDSVTPVLPGPSSAVADMDLLFLRSVRMDDYFMVSERWGNSTLRVTALMENGEPYATANVLQLGGATPTTGFGDPFTASDWNTGFAPQGTHSDQAFAITVFSAQKFFEGTGTQGGPIFGLRIDNDIEADVKIVGISANTFADNEINSNVIPEPSAFALALIGSLLFLGSRKRPA
jgi:hypothetical protein